MRWVFEYSQKKESIIAINFFVFIYCSWVSFIKLNDPFLGIMLYIQLFVANINQGFILGKYTFLGRCLDYFGCIVIIIKTIPHMINILPQDLFILSSLTSLLTNYAQITAPTEKSYILLVNIWHLQVAYLFTLLNNYN